MKTVLLKHPTTIRTNKHSSPFSMKKLHTVLPLLLAAFTFSPSTVEACDPCALFNATKLTEQSAGTFNLSLSEQLTSYEKADTNVFSGQFTREYSTTQLTGSYQFAERWGGQIILPWVVRRFDEVERFRTDSETEDGFGDMVGLLTYTAYQEASVDHALFVSLSAGVKFPTGDSGSIEEAGITAETGTARGAESLAHHQIGASTGLSGRVLSIGTGSYDFPLVAGISGRMDRLLLLAFAQYTVRTEGDFDYEFDDDLLWSTSAGTFLLLHDDYSLAAQIALSGEHKAKDTFNGASVPASDISNLYLGPALVLTAIDRVVGEFALDLPVDTKEGDRRLEPEYRLRAALSYRF
ncbi:MAG: hypothetical protein KDD69_02335 [Bdellovibrionales bacterium]|nr:hypothetical protein [Bdellovibrionales bacterium]